MKGFETIIEGKVYTREEASIYNNKIYIGIEKIEKGVNFDEWNLYLKQTVDKRYFYCSTYFTSKEHRFELEESKTGYETNSEKFNELCDSISNYWSNKSNDARNDARTDLYDGIASASYNWHLDNGYICYISTTPITGYYKHPSVEEVMTIKDYHEGYKNLLMTVQSKPIDDTIVFNNRGIFKHLDAIIEGGYPGLSMELHKVTGEFFASHFGKTHMTVSPMPTMFKIMQKALGENVLTGDQITPEFNHFGGFLSGIDTHCVIPIEALSAYEKDYTMPGGASVPAHAPVEVAPEVASDSSEDDPWAKFLKDLELKVQHENATSEPIGNATSEPTDCE